MLLNRLCGDVNRYAANNNLKSAPKKAVLAMPYSFTPTQCKALHTAASLAGDHFLKSFRGKIVSDKTKRIGCDWCCV
jgi:hypothetical protein